MSLMLGWSDASDPLYASSLVTLPHTQLLAADPHAPPTPVVQSNARYAAIRLPSTPTLFASVCSSSVPCGSAALFRKSSQPYSPAATTVRSVAPKTSGCLDAIVIASPASQKRIGQNEVTTPKLNVRLLGYVPRSMPRY